jgi:hypothetical protein
MKHAYLWVLTLLMVAGSVLAADKPDFSGEWKMNPEKSDYGPVPKPSSVTRKITHKEPSLTIVEEQVQNNAKQVTTRTMTTDGKPVTLDINGTQVNCSATWENNTLIVNSSADAFDIKFLEHMALSADGKVLTSDILVFSSQGDAALTIVYDKQ